MKQFFCPVCKAPIICTYEKPDFYFYQDENNNIVRDTNVDTIHGIGPYFHFHCSDDMEDNIEPLGSLVEYKEWKKEYKDSILTLLLKEGLI